MSNWQYEIDLKDEWDKAKERKLQAFELASIVSKKLTTLKQRIIKRFGESSDIIYEFQAVIDEFESFVQDKDEDFDDFDSVMANLYNLADTIVGDPKKWPPDKLFWINTI